MTKLAVRSMIKAPKDYYLLDLDLSQAEAWIVAYKCNDANMKAALNDKRPGYDIHTLTGRVVNDLREDASVSKDQRYLGKKCNHAFNYRMGPERAAQVINKEGLITVTVKQTKILHQRYHQFYNLKYWWTEIEDKLRADRTIVTVFGRRRVFYGPWGDSLFKDATADEPQSTIADHFLGAIQPEVGIEGGLKTVYNKIAKKSNGAIRIINTAHDSLVMEVPKSSVEEVGKEALSYMIRPLIINGEKFTIPADCRYFENWNEGGIEIKL